jgi:hypothetical protein
MLKSIHLNHFFKNIKYFLKIKKNLDVIILFIFARSRLIFFNNYNLIPDSNIYRDL